MKDWPHLSSVPSNEALSALPPPPCELNQRGYPLRVPNTPVTIPLVYSPKREKQHLFQYSLPRPTHLPVLAPHRRRLKHPGWNH